MTKQTDYIGLVGEFHKKFKQVINEKPTIPEQKTLELRLNLSIEEFIEGAEAMGPEAINYCQRLLFKKSQDIHYMTEKKREALKPDKVALLDALCDRMYVLCGDINAFGMQDVFPEAFEETQRSNMSKMCKDEEEAIVTQRKYADEGVQSKIEKQPEGHYLVFRTPDIKLLKSVGYSPADFNKFIITDVPETN